VVVQSEELDDAFNVPLVADVVRNPSRPGVQVMNIGLALGNELFPNPHWKWEVCQLVPVQMTDFAAPDMEEDHASAMRLDGHSGPRGHFALNLNRNRLRQHPYYYPNNLFWPVPTSRLGEPARSRSAALDGTSQQQPA
jgi:hypothetical protein